MGSNVCSLGGNVHVVHKQVNEDCMLGNLYTVYGQDSLTIVTIASDNVIRQEHILTMKQGEARFVRRK